MGQLVVNQVVEAREGVDRREMKINVEIVCGPNAPGFWPTVYSYALQNGGPVAHIQHGLEDEVSWLTGIREDRGLRNIKVWGLQIPSCSTMLPPGESVFSLAKSRLGQHH